MDREHLTEQELEILLDDDPGNDDPAAHDHLARCEECRTTYLSARKTITALEHLSYRSPAPGFSSRVMARVRVREPLYVSILDAVENFAPSGTGLRVALASAAAFFGLVFTGLLVWGASRADGLTFLANLGFEQGRLAALNGAEQIALGILGESTTARLGLSGMRGILFTLGLMGASGLVSMFGLRLLASAARRGGA